MVRAARPATAGAAPFLTVSVLDDVSPDTFVERLPAATKQLVEIAKVLTADSVKVIVFDEPTTALTESESDRLLDQIRQIPRRRVSPCFTSPTVWRRCSRSATGSPSCGTAGSPRAARCPDYDENKLITAMVGREVSVAVSRTRSATLGPARLSVRGLRRTR